MPMPSERAQIYAEPWARQAKDLGSVTVKEDDYFKTSHSDSWSTARVLGDQQFVTCMVCGE
ncbi:hypothetical protein N7517_004962 [Penicillium concentricum]|uniref:Uncharacterized protein n=1 Tax=Penicillium concentricum TaxID=293559 RepID=A0A9W9VB59_9EURO|nr:uncharacterized protein N7517_004962 [Penicillium concentricum]KAJ5372956.1 hypothetical protein N7517_004962 [Penicillium concentricum]